MKLIAATLLAALLSIAADEKLEGQPAFDANGEGHYLTSEEAKDLEESWTGSLEPGGANFYADFGTGVDRAGSLTEGTIGAGIDLAPHTDPPGLGVPERNFERKEAPDPCTGRQRLSLRDADVKGGAAGSLRGCGSK